MIRQAIKSPLLPATDTGITATTAADAVGKVNDRASFGEHIMAMVQYFEHGKKKPISAEKAAEKLGVTKQELHKLTDKQLEIRGFERIEAGYRRLFFKAYPELKNTDIVVHHALPQKLLEKYPDLFKAKEVNSIAFLRGIPPTALKDGKPVHDLITQRWERFLFPGRKITREQVLAELESIDKDFGLYFKPPKGKKAP